LKKKSRFTILDSDVYFPEIKMIREADGHFVKSICHFGNCGIVTNTQKDKCIIIKPIFKPSNLQMQIDSIPIVNHMQADNWDEYMQSPQTKEENLCSNGITCIHLIEKGYILKEFPLSKTGKCIVCEGVVAL
jgi:hypothetical protein